MAGYPGVGKSTIARALSRETGISLFDIDDIRKMVYAHPLDCNDDSRGRLSYNILKHLVSCHVSLGHSAIVDTPLTYHWLRDDMVAVHQEAQCHLHVVYCTCSDDVAEARNEARFASDPARYFDRHLRNYWRIKGAFEPIDDLVSIRVNTENPVDTNLAMLSDYLAQAHYALPTSAGS